ncbi:MAG: DUF2779 domain-containing protein [Candidatus Saganbacteria bacterium]|nr:DUF2779 domain-containing protein [Candidatus Saganbacteria bacterium]
MPKFLSKSRYISGLQCLKYLWFQFNRKKEIPGYTSETLEIFKQGRIVGELAHRLYPDGIKITRDWQPAGMSKKSNLALQQKKPLFEAGFIYKNFYAIADILVPNDDGSWDLIEVKSSTKVKDENLQDTAFQKFTYEGAGIKIKKCFLMHINNEYVKEGKIDPKEYFKKEDITSLVDELLPGIEKEADAMLEAIGQNDFPDIKVGPHCDSPYECPMQDLCWKFLPEDNVFILHRGSKSAYDLMERGILKLADIPSDFDLNDHHLIQVKAHGSGKAHIDKEGIGEFLSELKYPLYFLDFETIAPAIPIYDQTRPYEDVPFQYSLHVVEKEGAKPKHYSYLAPGDVDPRPEILKKLKKLLGDSGSIVAYNSGYEVKCLKYAARAYPEFEKWVEEIEGRMIDLWVPFRKFFYYHPAQAGSGSMKKVLPALTGVTYDGMEIGDGGTARFEYMRVTFGDGIKEDDRQKVRGALEKYCELDTKGMIDILRALGDLVGTK